MSELFTVETRTIDGVQHTRRVPYQYPKFPDRPYCIEHLTTGHRVLETPGALLEVEAAKTVEGRKQKPKFRPRPYFLLPPVDQQHATRYSADEARERVTRWALSNTDFRITKKQ